jgi:hypothetical protein
VKGDEMRELMAEYCTRKDFGYKILIYEKYHAEWGSFWEDVSWRLIGPMTLRTAGVKELDRNSLARMAKAAAREMMVSMGYPTGKITYNGSLLPRNPWGVLRSLRR